MKGDEMKFQRMLSNAMWSDEVKPDRIEMFINKAAEREQWFAPREGRDPRTAQEIRELLATGAEVTYDTDWYAKIRDADVQPKRQPRQPDYPDGRQLDCGHVVENKHEIMSASLGSSCEMCYDRMSD